MSHAHGNLQERALLRFRFVLLGRPKKPVISQVSACQEANSGNRFFAGLVTLRLNSWMGVAFANLAYSRPKSRD